MPIAGLIVDVVRQRECRSSSRYDSLIDIITKTIETAMLHFIDREKPLISGGRDKRFVRDGSV